MEKEFKVEFVPMTLTEQEMNLFVSILDNFTKAYGLQAVELAKQAKEVLARGVVVTQERK